MTEERETGIKGVKKKGTRNYREREKWKELHGLEKIQRLGNK